MTTKRTFTTEELNGFLQEYKNCKQVNYASIHAILFEKSLIDQLCDGVKQLNGLDKVRTASEFAEIYSDPINKEQTDSIQQIIMAGVTKEWPCHKELLLKLYDEEDVYEEGNICYSISDSVPREQIKYMGEVEDRIHDKTRAEFFNLCPDINIVTGDVFEQTQHDEI